MHVDGYSGPERDGWKALRALAVSSVLTVTEEMPTSPYAQWTHVRLLPLLTTVLSPAQLYLPVRLHLPVSVHPTSLLHAL